MYDTIITFFADDNKLTREEFRILEQVGNKENGLQESSYLNHFRRADTNHDAQLTAEELQKHYKALGYNYPLSTFTNTIREKDQNGDGKLGYQGKCTKLNVFALLS